MNTVYSKSSRERKSESGRGQGRITVDARELSRRFNGRDALDDERVSRERVEAFVWARDVEIGSVRICRMGAKGVEDEGLGMEYEVVGEKMILQR